MRLDQLINFRGLTPSRSKAHELIKKGRVLVNKKVCTKPSKDIEETAELMVLSKNDWVSRGAQKLSFALDFFEIQIDGKTVLDVGASTGGFTQVLLKRGANKIYAVDVGSGQLSSALKKEPKIFNMEKKDIRSLENTFDCFFDLVVVDISFISLSKVTGHINRVTKMKGEVVLLFKPQFEVGKKNLTKNGIVKDSKISLDALVGIISELEKIGLTYQMKVKSAIKGKTGNQETFIYLKKRE